MAWACKVENRRKDYTKQPRVLPSQTEPLQTDRFPPLSPPGGDWSGAVRRKQPFFSSTAWSCQSASAPPCVAQCHHDGDESVRASLQTNLALSRPEITSAHLALPVTLSYSITSRQHPPVHENPRYKGNDSRYVTWVPRMYCTQNPTPDRTTVPRRQIPHRQCHLRSPLGHDHEPRVLSPAGLAGCQYGVGENK